MISDPFVVAAQRKLVESLPPEELDGLFGLVEESERDRVKNPFRFFTPLPKQRRFMEAPFRNKWFFGGNQAGKTTTGAVIVIDDSLKIPSSLWWCGSETHETSRLVQQRKIHEMLPWDDVEVATYTPEHGFRHNKVRFKNGSEIQFRSYEQEREKWQGSTLNGIWFDEEPPWDLYQEGLARVVAKGGQIIGTMTSLSGYTRLVDEILRGRKKDIKVFFVSTYDNSEEVGGYISHENIKRLEESTDDKDRASRIEGRPVVKSGLVFDKLKHEEPIMIPLDREMAMDHKLRYVVSIDPHPRTPHGVLWVGVDPEGHLWVTRERSWLLKHGSMEKAQWVSPRQLVNEINQENIGKRVEQTIIDKFMSNQGNILLNTSFKDELMKEGLYTEDAGGDVEAKIVLMQQYIRDRRIHIFESCWNLWWELDRYVWAPFASERAADRREDKQKPLKKNDHLVDCLLNALLFIRHNEGVTFAPPSYARNPEGRNVIEAGDMHLSGPNMRYIEDENIMSMYQ
jgi:phage terminase large subunit-like protein